MGSGCAGDTQRCLSCQALEQHCICCYCLQLSKSAGGTVPLWVLLGAGGLALVALAALAAQVAVNRRLATQLRQRDKVRERHAMCRVARGAVLTTRGSRPPFGPERL